MRCFWNLANLKIINHPLVVSNMSINSANVFLKREEEKNIFCYFSERERESATGLFPQECHRSISTRFSPFLLGGGGAEQTSPTKFLGQVPNMQYKKE